MLASEIIGTMPFILSFCLPSQWLTSVTVSPAPRAAFRGAWAVGGNLGLIPPGRPVASLKSRGRQSCLRLGFL